jgi:hypothetical protein
LRRGIQLIAHPALGNIHVPTIEAATPTSPACRRDRQPVVLEGLLDSTVAGAPGIVTGHEQRISNVIQEAFTIGS